MADEHGTDPSADGPEEHPKGTLFLMLLFLLAIAGFWALAYAQLLRQG
jgi:hypothetical protein